jgi:two-component system sensor histidine kinase SenX3
MKLPSWIPQGAQIASSSEFITPDMRQVLDAFEQATLVLTPGENLIYYSPAALTLGVIRDDRITGEELIALIRVVRRTERPQTGTIEIPRGPIGEGVRKLAVKVRPIGTDGLILAMLSDESETERIDAVRRDFVANISHELKTPISALRTLGEAVEAANDDPQVAKFATMMQGEVERLSHLVQEIIDLSRLQDADPLLDAITVDIDEVVDQAIDQCQVLADNRNIEIVRGPKTASSVVGDRTHLIMAIHNLVENAVNYSPPKTRVTVNTVKENGLIEINVVDQGIGIEEENLSRIFERFYRVDPARSRETGGTGLGLSIVKHVARNHGGDVSVWSVEGVGSTFSFKLPVGEESMDGMEKS